MNNMLKSMASDDTELTKKLKIDEKLQKALEEDSVDSAVVLEELKSLNDGVLDHSKKTFRIRLERLLESTPLEIFLVVLVITDVIILLAMLLIDLNVLQMYLADSEHAAGEISHSLTTYCMGNPELQHYNGSNLITVNRLLEHDGCIWEVHNQSGTSTHGVVDDSHHRRKRSAAATEEEGSNPTIAVLLSVAHVLHIASIVILAIMVVEVLLKIFALGLKYFKGKLEVIDGIVIIISFAMDLYFIDGVGVNNGATVLVIFLLWRILRVFNALLVTAKKRLQFRIRVQKRMRRVLEDKLEDFEDDVKNLENHIENLNRLAKRHSLPDYEIKACKPLVKQMKRANTSAGLASMMQMSMGLMHGMNNMKGAGKTQSSIADNLRNPPSTIAEKGDPVSKVSDILIEATSATEKANRVVDVVHDPSNSVLPVPVMTAIATGSREGTPQVSRSNSSSNNERKISSVEFAKAVATGNSRDDSMPNGIGLRSWNDSSKVDNNNAKRHSEV